MTFSVSSSSVNKGESLRDTALTIEAMGVDAVVVRHRCSGAPHRVASWIGASVINGGDGWHDHPTQGLLDAFTLRSRVGPLDGCRVAVVGDVKHSRVARADVHAFATLGAQVTLVGPPTLLPPSVEGWPVSVSHDLDAVLGEVDCVALLRMQRERMTEALVPSLREYTARYGLTVDRARRLGPDVVVMHPGPMNRGVEIAPEVADDPRAVIVDQVRNGVAVRMAVLFRLLGAEARTRPVAEVATEAADAGVGSARPTATPGAGRVPPGLSPHARGARCRRRWSSRGGASSTRPASGRPTSSWPTGASPRSGPTSTATAPSTPGAAWWRPAWSTSTPTSASPARRRPRPSRRAAACAALGGFTAVVAMPNTTPAIDSAGVVREVQELARTALCAVHPSGAITVDRAGETLAPMAEMADLGVRIFTDDGTGVQDDLLMRRAMEYAVGLPHDVVLAQHCENSQLAAGGHMHEGEWSSRLGIAGQPHAAEEAMVARDIALARLTGARIHMQHMSTAGSVAMIAEARASGLPVSAEATPHHLLLTHAECAGFDPVFKVNPPLRTADDVAAVRAGRRRRHPRRDRHRPRPPHPGHQGRALRPGAARHAGPRVRPRRGPLRAGHAAGRGPGPHVVAPGGHRRAGRHPGRPGRGRAARPTCASSTPPPPGPSRPARPPAAAATSPTWATP